MQKLSFFIMTVTYRIEKSNTRSKKRRNSGAVEGSPRVKQNNREYIACPAYDETQHSTFQTAMKLTVNIGQCFGLNPVLGINGDPSAMRFSIYSGRCFYAIISIVGQFFAMSLCILKLITNSDSSMTANTAALFFASNLITTILFLRLATKWPRLCRKIVKIENADPIIDKRLILKCNLSCILTLVLAAAEHILCIIANLAIAIECQPENQTQYETFLLYYFPWIWEFIPFHRLYGFLAQLVSIQSTLNWNYTDVFIICISWYLASRYQQINKRIKEVKGKELSSYFWKTMREDYSRTTNLVRTIDDLIGSITFISFANNLFIICLQVLHSLEEQVRYISSCNNTKDNRPMRGYEQVIYFVYSSTFLISRSLAVSLIAARVHSVSQEPAQALYNVPSTGYNIEVQRFLHQIHDDSVALTGLQFFDVKRGIILSITGTIITYELVLIQFAGVAPTAPIPTVTIPV